MRHPHRTPVFAALTFVSLAIASCSSPASPVSPTSGAAVPPALDAAAPAAAPAQVSLCHRRGPGSYEPIGVPAPAEASHRAHGDGAVGEQLPDDPTIVFTAGCATAPVTVTLLIDVTAGAVGTFNFAGQSLSTPAGGPFNNLRFNWYNPIQDPAPAAFGTLYLLDQEYLGLPGDLGPSTPGYIAQSVSIVGGQYRFAPGVALAGGTQYWFYTDTQGAFVYSFDQNTYAGGDLYVTGVSTLPFHKAQSTGPVFLDANFRLEGAAVTP